MSDPSRLLPVARGDEPADLLLANGRVVDVFSGEVIDAAVAIADGRIAGVGDYDRAREILDLEGAFVAPGLIDAHVHIESSMLPPHEFGRAVVPRGTTAVVTDPHEIANVHGIEGIRYMLDSAARAPLSVFFMLPSCVPATAMETAGAALAAADLAPLMDDPRVLGLAEMMNFPGAILGDPGVLEKLRLGSRKRIDGHAPGVGGRWLQAYAACGISTDHESTDLEEARAKLRAGLRVWIREGSAAKNLDALLPLVLPRNAHRFGFCTDDRHPEDLVLEGHLDHVIRRAVSSGLDPVLAIRMATHFVASHYGRDDMGAVAPGRAADLVVFDDPMDFRPRRVYRGGRLVAENGRFLGPAAADPPAPPRGGVRLPEGFSTAALRVPAARGTTAIRVIGLRPGQITTESLTESPPVRDGAITADPARDLLKLAVIERHRGTGRVGLGFVRGFGFEAGALASTVAHDSHNLLVVGADDADMVVAARAVAEAGGGQAAARDGRVLALLRLPIAGLMSDRPLEDVVKEQSALREAAGALGSRVPDPFMPLSFLSLPVIPSLKLTDLGLVDVAKFDFVPLQIGSG